MADVGSKVECCCKNHVKCCVCFVNAELSWSKSLKSVPKATPATLTDWMSQCGRKNTSEKSYKFFREGYIHDMYAVHRNDQDHCFIKSRCYRSLKKSEDPHYFDSHAKGKHR